MDLPQLIRLILFVLAYPFIKLFNLLLLVFAPLWYALYFVLLPVIEIGNIISALLVLPFTFLAKFETLYIYLGIAGFVGVAAGSVLHLSFGLLKSVLQLDSTNDSGNARSFAEYRARRGKKKNKLRGRNNERLVAPPSVEFRNARGKHPPPNLPKQTIVEEDDSDI